MSEQWVPKTPAAVLGFATGCFFIATACGIMAQSWLVVFPAVITIMLAVATVDEIFQDQHAPTPPQPEKDQL